MRINRVFCLVVSLSLVLSTFLCADGSYASPLAPAGAALNADPDPKEPNDTCAQAAYLEVGNYTFHNASDVDWFWIELGAYYGLSVSAWGDGDCQVQIYRQDCETLLDSRVGGASVRPPTSAPRYYVRVSPAGGWTGEYQLRYEVSRWFYGSIEGRVYRTGTRVGVANAGIEIWFRPKNHPEEHLKYSTTTDWTGAFELADWYTDDWFGDFRIKEVDPPGYTSTGAEIDISEGGWINGFNEVGFFFSQVYPSAAVTFYDRPSISLGVQPVSGSSCAGSVQSFTTSYTVTAGINDLADDIATADFMLDADNWMADSVRLQYNRAQNGIYLRNESDTGWVAVGAPGSAQILQNRFVRVHLDQCQAAVSPGGRTLSITWALEFKPAFAGDYLLFVLASPEWGGTVGWEMLGAWTVRECATPTPAPMHWAHLPLLLKGR